MKDHFTPIPILFFFLCYGDIGTIFASDKKGVIMTSQKYKHKKVKKNLIFLFFSTVQLHITLNKIKEVNINKRFWS